MSSTQVRVVFYTVGTLLCALILSVPVAAVPMRQPPGPHDGGATSVRHVELLSYLPGEAGRTVSVWREHIYVVMGFELVVFNVREPSHPILVARFSLPPGDSSSSPDVSLNFRGDYAFVGVKGQIWQLDVSDPAKPVLMETFDLPGLYSKLLHTSADLLFVGDEYRVYMMKIQEDGSLETVGQYQSSRYIQDVWVQGDLAYVAESGLQVLDISDPNSPKPLIYIDVCCYRTLLPAGNRLYVLKGSSYDSVDIYSLSDPIRPERIGHYAPDHLFTDAAVLQNYLLLLDWNRLTIIDAADPAAPEQVGTYTGAFSASVGGVTEANGLVYFTDRGLRVLDLSALPSIREIGSFDSELREVMAINLQGSYAFVGDETGLHVLNIASPMTPTVAARVDFPVIGEVYLLAAAPPYLYPSSDRGAYIVNISDPEVPAVVGFRSGTRYTLRIHAADGSTAYAIAVEDQTEVRHRFVLFDTSNPSRWQEIGAIEVPSSGHLAVADEYAYLGTGNGLTIINLADPTTPVLVNRIDSLPALGPLVLDGSYLYAAAEFQGLRILDISDPDEPIEVSRYDLDLRRPEAGFVYITDMEVVGQYLYLSDHQRGVYVFDISDPSLPLEVGRYHSTIGIRSLSVQDFLVGTTHGYSGLSFYRFVPPDVTTTVGPAEETFDVVADAIHYAFPAGTFSAPISVTHGIRYWEPAAVGTDGLTVGGPIFRNSGINPTTNEWVVPGAAYDLTVVYNEASLGPLPEETLVLHWWNGETWIPQPSIVDTERNLLTASTMHFGTFTIFGEPDRLFLPAVSR